MHCRKIQGFLQESGLEGKIIDMKGEGYIPVQNVTADQGKEQGLQMWVCYTDES